MRLQADARPNANRKLMADSAALMFGGAAALSLLEAAIPGGPRIALVPSIGAFVLALVVSVTGPACRAARWRHWDRSPPR
jgi:hypothetical protein